MILDVNDAFAVLTARVRQFPPPSSEDAPAAVKFPVLVVSKRGAIDAINFGVWWKIRNRLGFGRRRCGIVKSRA